MLQNLNRLTFSAYGTVLGDRSENRGFPSGETWTERLETADETHVAVRRSAAPVYLDFEDGMAILAVEQEGRMLCFYLDKPVCLRAEVAFAIVPFQHECTVRLCHRADAPPRQVSAFHTADSLKVSRQFRIRDIYTLFYQEKEKGFFFKGEKHDVLELTYVDKGRLHSVADGVEYLLQQGEMMLYGANQWHMQYADDDVAVSFLTVTFDMECGDVSPLLNRKFSVSAQETALLQKMTAEQAQAECCSGDMIVCLLGQMLIRVLRTAQSAVAQRLQTPAAVNAENEIINNSLSYIAEHVRQKLSVGMVAQEVGVSASHLTALFHRCLQIAPGEYIRRTKLEESKLLIKEGRMNFTQIAAALNYSTVHHFSRQFKEKFGLTPSEYAKAIR